MIYLLTLHRISLRHVLTGGFLLLLCVASAQARAQRVVVIKIDGLPYDELNRFVRERDPRTGKGLLPWTEEVFYRNGTRVANFYVRGMSLSGPSWSLLDTGQHLQIKGNVEFDRLTLHSYDYLNFVPLYVQNAVGQRVDMPGVEVLDELQTPLLADAFAHNETYATFQLYQRGVRWTTLQKAIPENFKQNASDLISEWVLGVNWRNVVANQVERDLVAKLDDPQVRYLDYYVTEFDHAAHHNRDRETHLRALQDLDALIGRLWTAIEKSPLGAETALVLVSDHGFNSDEHIYSQGYNLVKMLGSTEGGGHHVITKRRLLLEYAVKGIYPLVPLVTTTTPDSYYLQGQSTAYPTALLDFDGNERAAIHLRDSDLNTLHLLLQQLQRKDLPSPQHNALSEAFFTVRDRRYAEWTNLLTELRAELQVLGADIVRQEAHAAAQKKLPKKVWTPAEKAQGLDKDAQRAAAQLDRNRTDFKDYSEFARTLDNLLSLRRETFHAEQWRIPDLIAKNCMGLANTVHELQDYVVAFGPAGPVFAADGSLDWQKSFKRVNYYDLLATRSVRNNVQPGVSNRPIDFIASRLPTDKFGTGLREFGDVDDQAVWLYGGPTQQVLILSRTDAAGRLSLRYVPVAELKQDAEGKITFTRRAWQEGLPLQIWEDEALAVTNRARWLDDWHTDEAWLTALNRTRYSNGLIGLHEQMTRHPNSAIDPQAPGLDEATRLRRRFLQRQRELVETDLQVFANDHWNFDVRGFNPGGNHGSFFRNATHSTLFFAGGAQTGIPRGTVINEPYDSLSFMPTVLALTGQLPDTANQLAQHGFRPFPGRIIPGIVNRNIGGGPVVTAR